MAYLQVKKKGYKRKGYDRKAYTIVRDGKRIRIPATHVSPAKVSPTSFEIKDIGAEGRGKKRVVIKRKGALKNVGYKVDESADKRHEALRKADKKYGSIAVFRMLQAQVVLRKRTQPKARKVFVEDRNWVEKNLLTKKEAREMTSKPRKAWMSESHAERVRARAR